MKRIEVPAGWLTAGSNEPTKTLITYNPHKIALGVRELVVFGSGALSIDPVTGEKNWKMAARSDNAAYCQNTGLLVLGLNEGKLLLVDTHSHRVIEERSEARADGSALAISPDGKWLAVAHESGNLSVIDIASWKKLWSIQAHKEKILSLQFMGKSNRLISGSKDDRFKVWNASTGESLDSTFRSFLRTFQGHSADVVSLALSDDESLFATGSANQEFRLWNASSGAKIHNIAWENSGGLGGLAFSHDGTTIFGGCFHGEVRGWNTQSGEKEIYLDTQGPDSIFDIAMHPTENKLATLNSARSVCIWELADKARVATFQV